jgi:hypothetical protein
VTSPSCNTNPHLKGFVAYGLGLSLSLNASEDERLGYKDHREDHVSFLSASDTKINVIGY